MAPVTKRSSLPMPPAASDVKIIPDAEYPSAQLKQEIKKAQTIDAEDGYKEMEAEPVLKKKKIKKRKTLVNKPSKKLQQYQAGEE